MHEGLHPFAGYSDFLVRTEGSSRLGSYHYEVWDTKLARSVKPYFAVHLCCYAEMLEAMQGRLPDMIGVVLGKGERRRLRTQDQLYYYRALNELFLAQQSSFDPSKPPVFRGMSDYGQWGGHIY
jgi:predicted RecB family nuclease